MNNPISLVLYGDRCPPTANSKWHGFLATIQRCAELGWKTHVVCTEMPQNAALYQPFQDCGCKIIIQPRARGNLDVGHIRRTSRILRETRCDVFHCNNVHTSPLIAARWAGVAVRVWSKQAMSPYYEEGISPKGLHRLMLSVRLSCAMANRVLAWSTAIKQELLAYGVAESRIQVLPAPVDIEGIAGVTGNGVREGLGVSQEDVLITTVGHAVPVKGWDVLVKAFGIVSRTQPAARLLLVGSLDSTEERAVADKLRAMVADLGLDGKVLLAGHRNDVADILKASDIFAFPSRSEGQGLALTEALASGLPCVAARVGGIPDQITHEDNGLLFPRENHEDLARCLLAIIADERYRQRLAKAALSSADRFALGTYVDSVLAVYTSLLGQAQAV